MRPEIAFDVFLIDCEADRIMMPRERGKLADQMLPDLLDGGAFGEFADQLGGVGAFAKGREQFEGETIHLLSRETMWPISGRINFSIASRHPSGEPGSAAINLPSRTPAIARLMIAAEPISLNDSILKISPKPSSSLSISDFTTSALPSRELIPVPP